MSLFKLLSERYCTEADEDPLDIGAAEAELDADANPDELPDEIPEEETANDQGDPKALVQSLVKYAPGKLKEIKNMLKYAANSDEDYDIFDSALDYYESIEDMLKAKSDNTDELPDEEPTDVPAEEPAAEEPTDELGANEFAETRNIRKNLGAP
jgi:hypothetical protein